jgi:hypothetical protein
MGLSPLIADIIVTTKGRSDVFMESFGSLVHNTPREQFRLTVIDDTGCSDHDTTNLQSIRGYDGLVDHYIVHRENMGLGPSINQGLAHVDALNRWFEHPTHGDSSQVAPLVVYTQDDVEYMPGWLLKLATRFLALEGLHKLAFASGHDAVEHPVRRDLGNGMLLKDYIRATNMMARRETWMSMFPIPRLDPETGRTRAKPNDGMGSGVDWHFLRNHERSVVRSGRTCLVMPGLVRHAGYRDSTWLDRELPESESDRKAMEESKL